MKAYSKEDWKKARLPILFLAIMIFISIYFGVSSSNELEENGVSGIGLVTGTYTVGKNSGSRFFFRTPDGIYTSVSSGANLTNYCYYRIRYSAKDPTIAEIYADSLIPDSIGYKIINYNEISRTNVINAEQVPDWQW